LKETGIREWKIENYEKGLEDKLEIQTGKRLAPPSEKTSKKLAKRSEALSGLKARVVNEERKKQKKGRIKK